eukprot:386461-Pyramimonas_sp.AAC.1
METSCTRFRSLLVFYIGVDRTDDPLGALDAIAISVATMWIAYEPRRTDYNHWKRTGCYV